MIGINKFKLDLVKVIMQSIIEKMSSNSDIAPFLI